MLRRFGLFFFFLVIALLAVIPSAYRYWNYYGFFPWETPPRRSVVAPPDYSSENVLDVTMPEQNPFDDDPEVGDGMILLDFAHDNNFKLPEIGALDSRLAARGFEFLEYRGGDLARQLRGVNAFVVIAPLANYSDEEIAAVTDFVEDGGRLLLMGDPTRFTVEFIEDDFGFIVDFNFVTNELPLNDLANEFDISFEGDYLYNLTAEGNESNFRNIVVAGDQFAAASDLTAELDTVVMYGAHSLEVGANALPLLDAGETTYSSATDRAGGRLLGAITEDEQVLALGDFTFMSDPYYTTLDNEHFIAHIADFLTTEDSNGRTYELADFPYFMDGTIELNYVGDVDLGPGAFDDIINLQNSFAAVDQTLEVTAEPSGDNNVLHLGVYNQALTDDAVLALLADAGLELIIDPPVLTIPEQIEIMKAEEAAAEAAAEAASEAGEDAENTDETDEEMIEAEEEEEEIEVIQVINSPMGRIEMAGTSLILLTEAEDGRYEIVVLGASKDGLENTVNRLLDLMPLDADYALNDCLTTSTMALCPSDVSSEEIEPELITGIEPELPDSDQEDEEEEPVEEEEIDEETEEEDPVEEDDPFRSSLDDLSAPVVDQGTAVLDEALLGELATDEFHSWTYEGDSITAEVVVTTDDIVDAVLSVYDDEGFLTEYADSGFAGDPESLIEITLEDGYLVLVNDFGLNDAGEYTVTVTSLGALEETAPEEDEEDATDADESEGDEAADEETDNADETDEADESEEDAAEPAPAATDGIESIFIYFDDNGEFLGSDESETVDIETLISSDYDVTLWQVSEQDELELSDLEGYDLIVWYSAEYQEAEIDFTDESNLIFEILFEGGNLLVIGSTPPMLEPAELVEISTVRFIDHPILDGLDLPLDETFPLADTYTTTLFDLTEEDLSDGEEIFAVRADNDEYIDDSVGVTINDEFGDVRILFFGLPLQAFDEDVQSGLIENMLIWFSENSGE